MTNKKELVRFNGTLPVEIHTSLKKIADDNQRSLNNIINVILTDYCNKHDKKENDEDDNFSLF